MISQVDSDNKSKTKAGSLITRSVLVGSALVTLWLASIPCRELFNERRLGQASLTWTQTEGVVIQSEYHKNRGRRTSTGSGRIYYKYRVDENIYFSGQVDASGKRAWADLVNLCPVGAKITVYFDPNRPTSVVIVPGIARETTFFLFVFFALLGVLAVFWILLIFATVRSFVAKLGLLLAIFLIRVLGKLIGEKKKTSRRIKGQADLKS